MYRDCVVVVVVIVVVFVIGTRCVHRNVLLLSSVHGGCTVGAYKCTVVATSIWWVHINVLLLSLVHGGCRVGAHKCTLVATSTRWVHNDVLFSLVYGECIVGA